MHKLLNYLPLLISLILVTTSCGNDDKVITSFGYMNEKLEESTSLTEVKNGVYRGIFERKVKQDSLKHAPTHKRLMGAQKVSNEFYYYLESLKDSVYKGTLGKNDARTSYEKLVSSKYLDKHFFDAKSLTTSGKEFLLEINEYKNGFKQALGKGYGTVASMVSSRFRTKELMDYSGNIIPWLNFKFESFPAMASIFNISQMQYDIRQIEMELIDAMNSGEFEKEFAMRNYTGIVRLDKGSYYPDERITGKVVMGRFDESIEPFDIVMNGRELSEQYATEGAVLVDFKAPKPGEYPLNGNFTVLYDGTPVKINYNSKYKVVSRDNIVEKIVYKTEYVDKPVYIDRPVYIKEKTKATPKVTPEVTTETQPVAETEPKVIANSKTRKYYTPSKKASPEIEGTVNNEKGGYVTMLKTTLRQAKLGAVRTKDNQTFDVTSFKIKVPGLLTVYVEGNEFTREAIRTIDKARTGQRVTIFDIKAVDANGVRVGKVKEIKISVKR